MPVATMRAGFLNRLRACVTQTVTPSDEPRRRSRLTALGVLVLTACSPVTEAPSRAAPLAQTLPPMQMFTSGRVAPAARPNSQIAQDFLDLSFRMESGKQVQTLTRFETPITVRVTGGASPAMLADLDRLLTRLRAEARIDIRLTAAADANITIETVPQRELQRAVPRAACFVVPRVTSWRDFLSQRFTSTVDWTTLTVRDRAAIFIPADAAPQEMRDCLHEELAQALGPLNDLYRLPDSVFNDDNIHAVLTGFDMLLLRAYYDDSLRSGLSRTEVAARLPAILARLNPRGEGRRVAADTDTSRDWIDAVETALTGTGLPGTRRAAAQRAIALGRAFGWTGPREGFAHYAYGRLQVGNDPQAALAAFNHAEAVYRASPATQIHAAHIAVQKCAFALSSGDAPAVIAMADAAMPVAAAHENAALLATLMMMKAEALEMQGATVPARQLRLDSLGWARYGFGSDANVQARLNEVAGLRPF